MMPHKQHNTAHPARSAVLAILLATAVGLAGCTSEASNKAPEAVMDVSDNDTWAGTAVTFDGQASRDPDGSVVRYAFDFGDGTTMVADDEDEARVTHTYTRGGVFTVTLTVTDDGQDQEGARTDTASDRIAVSAREPVDATVIAPSAGLPQQGSSVDATPVNVTRDAKAIEVELEVTGLLVVGTSEVLVELVGPNGTVIEDETVLVDGTASKSASMVQEAPDLGEYVLRITAKSGGADATGEVRTTYAL